MDENDMVAASLIRIGTTCSPNAGKKAIAAPMRKKIRENAHTLASAIPVTVDMLLIKRLPSPQSPGGHRQKILRKKKQGLKLRG